MIFDIDETDVKSISAALSKLHKLRTKLCKNDPTARISNIRFDKRLATGQDEYEAMKSIFSTDISSVYHNEDETDKSFYVYAHCNPEAVLQIKDNARHLFAAVDLKLSSQPFYIGKGKDGRAFDLNRNEGHTKIKQHLKKIGKEIEVVKIADNLTSAQALAIESKLIDILGLKVLSRRSLLVNLDEGQAPKERRSLYAKGIRGPGWYLNKIKLQPYSVPKG